MGYKWSRGGKMKISTNPVTKTSAEIILGSLPEARRQRYMDLAGQKGPLVAAQIYLWNSYVAAAILRTTGFAEVQLRTVIDESFAEWNIQHGGTREWITDPVDLLATVVAQPKRPLRSFADLKTAGPNPTHNDYVAGLSFGSWTQLLPTSHYQNDRNPRHVLWVEAIRPRLTHADETNFSSRANSLRTIRNRASHHRPIISEENAVRQAHQDSVELCKMINPKLGEWLRRERWILEALNQSPLK